MAPRRVRKALRRLRQQLPEGRPLAGVRIAMEGSRIVVADGSRRWQPDSGQILFDFGVADLPGNNDEVVASETFDAGWRGKFDSVHTGGPWYKGVRNQCRPKIYTHDEGFYYYFLGFRCCAEPDGAPTDPLTPKQRDKGWKLDRVERIAGVTLDETKQALEKKKQGKCQCSEHDIKCKTLCGTLLGPEAKDYK